MTSLTQDAPDAGAHDSTDRTTDLDAVIVGAGFAGMYMLYRLRDELGLQARAFEAGSGVGGTWYWNRYPGARCDSDSYVYCYSFSPELRQEWEWSERYPEQPEILRYLNHVADRFDLRRDIQLNTRISEAAYDESRNRWSIRTDAGEAFTAHYFITAAGCLSSANVPKFKGLETFQGAWYHTGKWPHEGVDFTGKRVGVIGTGATAVQAVPFIARQADHLTVFQRTPNYIVPARNGPVPAEVIKARKADYDAIVQRTRSSFAGFELYFIEKSALEATPEEREREFDKRWETGGFGLWLGNYNDIFFSQEANETTAEYLRTKIRETVKDPVTAEKLIPKDYPYGTKRQPLGDDYYETFNRDNVTLVDVSSAPIEEITPTGLRTKDAEYEFDCIVFATGYDALTGPLNKIKISGRGGRLLKDKWADGPHSYLGVATTGFPNMFTITGPGSPSVLSNMPVSIEQHVEWISDCIAYMREHQLEVMEPTAEAEEQWTNHVAEVANTTLFPKANSWYIGANIPGKPRVFMPYLGGVGPYRAKCTEIAADGYPGFAFA
jgi:cation diffusion facilitator CzcD-associated flavoprotein CzcO